MPRPEALARPAGRYVSRVIPNRPTERSQSVRIAPSILLREGAKVTADPAKIAYVRHELALETLLAIRPGQIEERNLARQVVDLAADELSLALSHRKHLGVLPVPRAAATPLRLSRTVPLAGRPGVAIPPTLP